MMGAVVEVEEEWGLLMKVCKVSQVRKSHYLCLAWALEMTPLSCMWGEAAREACSCFPALSLWVR